MMGIMNHQIADGLLIKNKDTTREYRAKERRESMDETLRKVRQELKTCANELCLQCGKYKFEYQGACEDCRWLPVRKMEVDQDDAG
jgi:uncharacterized OB-fold protein